MGRVFFEKCGGLVYEKPEFHDSPLTSVGLKTRTLKAFAGGLHYQFILLA